MMENTRKSAMLEQTKHVLKGLRRETHLIYSELSEWQNAMQRMIDHMELEVMSGNQVSRKDIIRWIEQTNQNTKFLECFELFLYCMEIKLFKGPAGDPPDEGNEILPADRLTPLEREFLAGQLIRMRPVLIDNFLREKVGESHGWRENAQQILHFIEQEVISVKGISVSSGTIEKFLRKNDQDSKFKESWILYLYFNGQIQYLSEVRTTKLGYINYNLVVHDIPRLEEDEAKYLRKGRKRRISPDDTNDVTRGKTKKAKKKKAKTKKAKHPRGAKVTQTAGFKDASLTQEHEQVIDTSSIVAENIVAKDGLAFPPVEEIRILFQASDRKNYPKPEFAADGTQKPSVEASRNISASLRIPTPREVRAMKKSERTMKKLGGFFSPEAQAVIDTASQKRTERVTFADQEITEDSDAQTGREQADGPAAVSIDRFHEEDVSLTQEHEQVIDADIVAENIVAKDGVAFPPVEESRILFQASDRKNYPKPEFAADGTQKPSIEATRQSVDVVPPSPLIQGQERHPHIRPYIQEVGPLSFGKSRAFVCFQVLFWILMVFISWRLGISKGAAINDGRMAGLPWQ
jgi:hypothetical protein